MIHRSLVALVALVAFAGAAQAQTLSPSALPGGSNGNVQINNSGSFGGIATSGTGSAVLATSPTLTTPTIGAANATSVKFTDATISRVAANELVIQNGASPNALLIANSYTDGSNYTAGLFTWGASRFNVGTTSAGTGSPSDFVLEAGTGHNIVLQTATVDRWNLGPTGMLTAVADNTYDIGASGSGRPRSLFLGSALAVAGAITAPGLAASSGATTGTLCWTTSTGNFTVDTTTTCLASDIRTKTKIGSLGPMLTEIMAMKPIHYENKPGMGLAALGEEVGLSAQDMLKVDPRLVALYGSGPDKGTPQGVRYQQLTAVLVKGEQELLARIVALESQNIALKAQVKRITRRR